MLALILLLGVSAAAQAARIKDLAEIAGVRSNQLLGYGLVVGLDGSGDKDNAAPYTMQSLRSMLTQLGIVVPPGVKLKPKNVAAVSIHAELPPFAKNGQRIDVTVSSIGDAKNLRGGSLLMTPLKGADGQVYAVAQGNLVVGGLSAGGADGSSVTINIPTAGRIPNGATVERTVETLFNTGDYLTLNLKMGDFTTVKRMVDVINKQLGTGTAQALDASSVRVNAPLDPSQRVGFYAFIENLEINPGMAAAKVIVNSRTGTVVISSEVRVSPAAVSHGNLVVTISEDAAVSQPNPLSGGTTQVVPQSQVGVSEQDSRMFLFNPGTTLDEVVRAVNQVGAAPSDLVAILEALKQAGALQAELVII
ncbi:MAG: flagellar basal body P-ring protein FlgI [Chromatiaceae bacterium]|nr:flagellar basal body P-ring protein FlgI [Gammaproteobacteria bacterium]MCB1879954.1 flagellar basal body P-ring protein FlgI [Gammaproteobacteria bacterium]MCP5427279.1 flagellar basal body P-ring protein FlgI [Chromatiaceae bacterium]MCP5447884.1 flagellar basal body P-ring protein FlgI [Chromatiaceae bacterium]